LRELVQKQLEILRPEFPNGRGRNAPSPRFWTWKRAGTAETIDKGTRAIHPASKRGQTIGVKELIDLYDSQGLPPQVVRPGRGTLGVKVEIPDAST